MPHADSVSAALGYEPLVFELPVPDKPLTGLTLASPLTVKIGYVRVATARAKNPDSGVLWRVDLGLAKPAEGDLGVIPCLVMRPVLDPLLDREVLMESWEAWQQAMVDHNGADDPSQPIRRLPALETIWPSLAPGGRLRRAVSLWSHASRNDEAFAEYVASLRDREDVGLIDDLVIQGAVTHVLLERAERADRVRSRQAQSATMHQLSREDSAESGQRFALRRDDGLAEALEEQFGRASLSYGDIATDAIETVKARRAGKRGARPRTSLPTLAQHVYGVLRSAVEAGEAMTVDAFQTLSERERRAVRDRQTRRFTHTQRDEGDEAPELREAPEYFRKAKQFFSACISGSWAETVPQPPPPEMARQLDSAEVCAEIEREDDEEYWVLNDLPRSIRKMSEQLAKAEGLIAEYGPEQPMPKGYRTRPDRQRWHFLKPFLLGDNGAFIAPVVRQRLLLDIDPGTYPQAVLSNAELLGTTAGVLLDALRLDSMHALLDTVGIREWGHWELTVTPGETMRDLATACWRPLMLVRVQVEASNPHYRRALGAVPEAEPGHPIDTIVAGFVSPETAAWVDENGWSSAAADERLMAEAQSIRDRQVAPDAGRVTVLTFDPRKPPAPKMI